MKKVSARALIALVFAGVILLGLLVFVVQYFVKAEDWVTFSGSPHVYSGGNLSTGTVTDRDGGLLLENTGDGRVYTQDAALRTSLVHLLGDRDGYIAAPILGAYTDEMLGYSSIGGLYRVTQSGNTLALTVSAAVQEAAYAALGSNQGTVGVYNYQTGEILCMVSSPAYDPTAKPDFDETDPAWEGVYTNRFLSSSYVPGSIFKLITLSAALETLPDVQAMSFYCGGELYVQGDKITCTGFHGTQTLEQALANSCNVAFATLAELVGPTALQATADAYGIGTAVELDRVQTAAGHFDVSTAAQSQIDWAAIGQYTDTVNPAQFLTVLGAIAHDGTAAQPYLVQSVTTPLGKTVYQAKTTYGSQVVSAQTAQTVADYMASCVQWTYGAGNFGGLTVCAKSGTAEVGGDLTSNAMFAGFVRDESCPVAFFIALENAGSGAANCVPVAAQVLAACQTALAQ